MHDTFYQNPVYPHRCPDPFVLKHLGTYWAYCTGLWDDGSAFGILRSPDLVTWEVVDGAMAPLEGDFPCYWAPEVTYDNGRFYMYYSVGNEATMQIRVATADNPDGPFTDSGRTLTREPFAIDAHVFINRDGTWYLFYATDFLDHPRVGTGTVMDRMLDPFTLEGSPRPVTRAKYDWQIYDPNRASKGGVCWHTLEGPFVLEHRHRYYQMFSGGNWQNPSYGVCYATAESLDAPGEWNQTCNGVDSLPILRSLPDQDVIGPGHNSVVSGPDNRQRFCVYHRWATKNDERVLNIDPLEFVGDRLAVLGPTNDPELRPIAPTLDDFSLWRTAGGLWERSTHELCQKSGVPWAAAHLDLPSINFLMELYLSEPNPVRAGELALGLECADGTMWRLTVAGGAGWASVLRAGTPTETYALPSGYDAAAYHRLRLEVDGTRVSVLLDGRSIDWRGRLNAPPVCASLITRNTAGTFAAFALTEGWELPFAGLDQSPRKAGWRVGTPGDRWRFEESELHGRAPDGFRAVISRAVSRPDYELVVTARLAGPHPEGAYEIGPALNGAGEGPMFVVEPEAFGWCLRCAEVDQAFPLPESFDPATDWQFRFRRIGREVDVRLEGHWMGTVPLPDVPTTRVGLCVTGGDAAFSLVRVTTIPARRPL